MSAPTSTDPEHPLTSAVTAELPPGALLHDGRYRVLSVLGRGGFGITYATEDCARYRRVAVKELFPDPVVRDGRRVRPPAHAAEAFRAARERFLREAAVLARFTDPGIVRVHDVFEENGTAYLVMELLEGRTLGDLLDERGGPLTEREALDLAVRCGRSLAVVHRAGVLHRDLNPTNIMVTRDGRVVLIDFGLAQTFTAEQTGVMTRLVTPGYAPPEQYRGEARFGPPTDVYGLAATLYRLLAGRAPLNALDRQGGMALTPPRRFNPKVSRLVSDGVLDGLELHAPHRPQDMAAFLARLGIVEPIDPLATVPVVDDPEGSTAHYLPPPTGAFGRTAPPVERAHRQARPEQPRLPVFHPPPPIVVSPAPAVPDAYDSNRWKVALPTLTAVAALGSAAPLMTAVVLAFVALPALATVGDAIVFVRVRRRAERLQWRHRVALPPLVPVRFLRNLGTVLYMGVPALLLMSSVVAVGLLLDAAGASQPMQEIVVRPGGVGVALLLVVPLLRRRERTRAAIAAAEVEGRWLDTSGRLTHAGLVLWVAAALIAVIGLGFRPDLWPLSGG